MIFLQRIVFCSGFYDIVVEDATWVLITPLIIFTMQTGFALVESGVVRTKNEVNIMMKNVVDVCFGGLSYYIFGFGLMFGRGEYTSPFLAVGDFFVNLPPGHPLMGQLFTLFFFEMSFATTSTTIVSGACAERFRFHAYVLFSFINTVVYAIAGGWVWGEHGFLRQMGVVDFAGAGPIHVVGGAAALTAAWFIGPRIGRYDKGPKSLPMGNPMSACMGLFILWWGWIGFNAGSSYGITGGKWDYAARAGVGTTVATMAAGVFSILYSMYKNKGKVDVFEVISGILASLGKI